MSMHDTVASTALVTLAEMVGESRENIGTATTSLWEAPCVDTANVPAMKGIKLCGAGLMLLLERADLRAHLRRLVVYRDVPQVDFVWRDGRRTIFAPDPHDADARGTTRVAELSGVALSKVADLIARRLSDNVHYD